VCSLRAAIEEANAATDFDVIQFLTPSVFSVNQTIVMTGVEYSIYAGVSIQGPTTATVTIDAGNINRHFFIAGNPDVVVLIDHLVLLDGNGTGGDGGSVRNITRLTLSNLTINSSQACSGGGLLNDTTGRTILTNVVISGSSGFCAGGGIYNLGELTADNLSLINNDTATDGGGLYNCECATATLMNSLVSGNTAVDWGGGIFNDGELILDNTDVVDNSAGLDGGGIADGVGFGVAAQAANRPSSPTLCVGTCGPTLDVINGSLVANNVAGDTVTEAWGGGIFHPFGSLVINSSAVTSNTVYGLGGGIANGQFLGFELSAPTGPGIDPASAVIQNGSLIAANRALSLTDFCDPCQPGVGGGIYNAGMATVDGSTVAGNGANLAGGIYNESADPCFIQCTFAPTGAVLFFEPLLLVINQSLVAGNLASTADLGDINSFEFLAGTGGGIFNAGHAEVVSSTVSENGATLLGAGLFNGIPTFFASRAANAPSGPGFLFLFQPTLLARGSLISENSVVITEEFPEAGWGGGLYNLLGHVVLDDSDVLSNTANLGGGAANGFPYFIANQVNMPNGLTELDFYLLARLEALNGTQIAHNASNPFQDTALSFSGGGGLFNLGAVVVRDSAVVSNTAYETPDFIAPGLGGGILNHGLLTLNGAQVGGNAADYVGGGIANIPFNFIAPLAAESAGPMAPSGFVPFIEPPEGLSLEASLVTQNGTTISDNAANPNNLDNGGGAGGGLFNALEALLEDTTVGGNTAASVGGGIMHVFACFSAGAELLAPTCLNAAEGLSNFEALTINDSSIEDNQAGRSLAGDNPDFGRGGGLYVDTFDVVTVNDSEFNGNSATAGGGGVYVNLGKVFLHSTDLVGNNADRDGDLIGDGGGTYSNGGELYIDPTNIVGNLAANGAGGIFVNGYTLITQTTFATNTATISGGGIVVSGTALVEAANATFSGNSAAVSGGGIHMENDQATLTMANVTIFNNESLVGAGLAIFNNGALHIFNTIIFGNGAVTADCQFVGLPTGTNGSNMGDATCDALIAGWTVDDPELGPLQDNGGANDILTHALAAGSPAIGTADYSICIDTLVEGVDERGANRTLNFTCDIGAFEREALTSIELLYFTGKPVGDDSARLRWETTVEIDTAGYNLYRASAPGGPYVQINGLLIAAVGASEYEYLDVPGAGTWYYKLEDVDTQGAKVTHGPVEVTVGSGTSSSFRIYMPIVGQRH
jgi:predicted outer membrane repeat protein